MPTYIQTTREVKNSFTTTTATIASGASLSGIIDLGTNDLIGIIFPATWTTASITFQFSIDGTNFYDAYSSTAELSSTAASASRMISINAVTYDMGRYIKIRSGTSATPVNQAADRILTLILG
jgi:hypothetical protein